MRAQHMNPELAVFCGSFFFVFFLSVGGSREKQLARVVTAIRTVPRPEILRFSLFRNPDWIISPEKNKQ